MCQQIQAILRREISLDPPVLEVPQEVPAGKKLPNPQFGGDSGIDISVSGIDISASDIQAPDASDDAGDR